jgi:sugar phosphate permease
VLGALSLALFLGVCFVITEGRSPAPMLPLSFFRNPTFSAATVIGLLILPLGVGLAVPAMTASLLGTVPKARSGAASGVLNTVRQSAGAVGVALYGAFLATAGVPGIRTAFALSSVLLLLAAVVAALGIRERNPCPNLSGECRVPGVE